MATCKDCFNFGDCLKSGETPHYAVDGCNKDVEKRCKNFKNKADFVKVVRCSECKYKDECWQKVDCECAYKEIVYCSYGERKDDA